MSSLFDISQLEGVEAHLDSLLAHTYPKVDITPSLLITTHSARAAHRNVLENTLLDLSANQAAVRSIRDKVARLEAELHLKELSVKRAIPPVSALPTELLREVFILDVSGSLIHGQEAKRLAHVCSEWRSVAIGTQSLWHHIVIGPNGADSFAELAARSGNLPLSVVLNPVQTGTMVINEVDASRIQDVMFIGKQTPPQISALDLCAPHLSLERVAFERRAGGTSSTIPIIQIHPGITSAKTLLSMSCSFRNPDELVLPRLETLILETLGSRDVSKSLQSIRTTPIKRLYLDDIHAAEDLVLDLPLIHPHRADATIQSLNLSYSEFNIFKTICQHWRMDNLKSLDLSEILHAASDAVRTESALLFLSLFENAPNITKLSVELDNLMYMAFSTIISQAAILPLLETLTLSLTDNRTAHPEEETQSVLDIVRGRSHRKLKHLRVTRDVLSGRADDMEKIKELVENFEVLDHLGDITYFDDASAS